MNRLGRILVGLTLLVMLAVACGNAAPSSGTDRAPTALPSGQAGGSSTSASPSVEVPSIEVQAATPSPVASVDGTQTAAPLPSTEPDAVEVAGAAQNLTKPRLLYFWARW